MEAHVSCCQYLFKKEAESIFSNLKEMRVEEKRAYIDQCLDLMIRVHVYILTQKQGFCLVDPMAYNDQCHLYSLRAAQIQVHYKDKTIEDKLAKTEENRFLHLSLFLSFNLAADTTLMLQVVLKAINEMGIEKPRFKRKLKYDPFETFILDEGRGRERASRIALNEVFKAHLLQEFQKNTPLYQELSSLAQEDLLKASNRGKKEGIFYTFPKFAGIAYLIDVIQEEQIPFIIKAKVVTKEGSPGNLCVPIGEIKDEKPGLVFEGFASNDMSLEECRSDTTKCPTYFHRDLKKCHLEEETCSYCKTSEADLTQNIKNIEIALESPEDFLYACSADSVLKKQTEFIRHFENKIKYPILSDLFEKAIPKIAELGLDSDHPKTFSPCHVHMEIGTQAVSKQLLLSQTQKHFLQERGLI